MAGSLNRVQLIGNVGKDPEIKSFSNGNRVANFSIACNETWKDKTTGEKKEKIEWINVAVFNEGIIGVVERYVKKGSKLFVEGKYQTRNYEKDGQKLYVTEVVIQNFGGQIVLLGDPSVGASASSSAGGYDKTRARSPETARAGYDPGPDPDDEIPF